MIAPDWSFSSFERSHSNIFNAIRDEWFFSAKRSQEPIAKCNSKIQGLVRAGSSVLLKPGILIQLVPSTTNDSLVPCGTKTYDSHLYTRFFRAPAQMQS